MKYADSGVNIDAATRALARSRDPRIVADAAHLILTSRRTGQTLIDDEVLAEAGITDLSGYSYLPGATDLQTDVFLD